VGTCRPVHHPRAGAAAHLPERTGRVPCPAELHPFSNRLAKPSENGLLIGELNRHAETFGRRMRLPRWIPTRSQQLRVRGSRSESDSRMARVELWRGDLPPGNAGEENVHPDCDSLPPSAAELRAARARSPRLERRERDFSNSSKPRITSRGLSDRTAAGAGHRLGVSRPTITNLHAPRLRPHYRSLSWENKPRSRARRPGRWLALLRSLILPTAGEATPGAEERPVETVYGENRAKERSRLAMKAGSSAVDRGCFSWSQRWGMPIESLGTPSRTV
jgi:hypothetical protein